MSMFETRYGRVKRRKLEKIVDPSGWEFYMPKLDDEEIEEFGLTEWDLADYMFGTINAMFWYYRPSYEFKLIEVVLWKIENLLRILQWYTILNGIQNRLAKHDTRATLYKILDMFIATIRIPLFTIACKISELIGG